MQLQLELYQEALLLYRDHEQKSSQKWQSIRNKTPQAIQMIEANKTVSPEPLSEINWQAGHLYIHFDASACWGMPKFPEIVKPSVLRQRMLLTAILRNIIYHRSLFLYKKGMVHQNEVTPKS